MVGLHSWLSTILDTSGALGQRLIATSSPLAPCVTTSIWPSTSFPQVQPDGDLPLSVPRTSSFLPEAFLMEHGDIIPHLSWIYNPEVQEVDSHGATQD